MAELPEGLEFTLTNLQHMQEEILLCACGRDKRMWYVLVPCAGRAFGPSPARPAASGPGLYIISRAGPGLGLHTAGPGRAWAGNNLNTSGLGRAWA